MEREENSFSGAWEIRCQYLTPNRDRGFKLLLACNLVRPSSSEKKSPDAFTPTCTAGVRRIREAKYTRKKARECLLYERAILHYGTPISM